MSKTAAFRAIGTKWFGIQHQWPLINTKLAPRTACYGAGVSLIDVERTLAALRDR
jgi:hypothetical protein